MSDHDSMVTVEQCDNERTVALTEWLILNDYFFEDGPANELRQQEAFGALADQLFARHRLAQSRPDPGVREALEERIIDFARSAYVQGYGDGAEDEREGREPHPDTVREGFLNFRENNKLLTALALPQSPPEVQAAAPCVVHYYIGGRCLHCEKPDPSAADKALPQSPPRPSDDPGAFSPLEQAREIVASVFDRKADALASIARWPNASAVRIVREQAAEYRAGRRDSTEQMKIAIAALQAQEARLAEARRVIEAAFSPTVANWSEMARAFLATPSTAAKETDR